jgi:hypothetical protein
MTGFDPGSSHVCCVFTVTGWLARMPYLYQCRRFAAPQRRASLPPRCCDRQCGRRRASVVVLAGLACCWLVVHVVLLPFLSMELCCPINGAFGSGYGKPLGWCKSRNLLTATAHCAGCKAWLAPYVYFFRYGSVSVDARNVDRVFFSQLWPVCVAASHSFWLK